MRDRNLPAPAAKERRASERRTKPAGGYAGPERRSAPRRRFTEKSDLE